MHANRVIFTVPFQTYSISVSCYSSSLCFKHSSPQRRCPAFASLGRQIISSAGPFSKASSSDANLYGVQKGPAETKVGSLCTRLTLIVRVQQVHFRPKHSASSHPPRAGHIQRTSSPITTPDIFSSDSIGRLFLRNAFTQHRHSGVTLRTQHHNNCMLRILTPNHWKHCHINLSSHLIERKYTPVPRHAVLTI